MKAKILATIVCTLLIATITSSAEIIFKTASNKVKQNLLQNDDIPIWETGYSWSYSGEINMGDESTPLLLILNELCIQIIDTTGVTYRAIFGGDVEGEFLVVPDIPLSIVVESLTGEIELIQSNIGIKNVEAQIKGKPKIGGSILPISAEASIIMNFNPGYAMIDFPIYVGKTWTVPPNHITGEISVKVFGIIEQSYGIDQNSAGDNLECLEKVDVTAGGNIYNAYRITPVGGGSSGGYYCPDIGNLVLIEFELGDPIIELIATNYPTPDNPQKPDTPVGPINGGIGKSYNYETKAVDPKNDQMNFGWDWDGDLFIDEWTGLYDSDVTIITAHTWNHQGSYNIRVKARDTTGKESVWSEPLAITMPRTRIVNSPFLKFLENLQNQFPILQLILQLLDLQ